MYLVAPGYLHNFFRVLKTLFKTPQRRYRVMSEPRGDKERLAEAGRALQVAVRRLRVGDSWTHPEDWMQDRALSGRNTMNTIPGADSSGHTTSPGTREAVRVPAKKSFCRMIDKPASTVDEVSCWSSSSATSDEESEEVFTLKFDRKRCDRHGRLASCGNPILDAHDMYARPLSHLRLLICHQQTRLSAISKKAA